MIYTNGILQPLVLEAFSCLICFSLWNHGLAGLTAGVYMVTILGPGERVKCLLQVTNLDIKYLTVMRNFILYETKQTQGGLGLLGLH